MVQARADSMWLLVGQDRRGTAGIDGVFEQRHDRTHRFAPIRQHTGGGIMKKLLLAAAASFVAIATASAADMPGPMYTKAPVVAAYYDWTGFYVGGTAGGAWGSSDPTTSTVFSPLGYFAASSVPAVNSAGRQHISPSGFTGGIEAGYNWQTGFLVFGVETDFEAMNLRGSTASSAFYPAFAPGMFTVASNVSTSWLFTARPRLGFAANNWLFYATGGLALTDLSGNFSFGDNCGSVAGCNGPGVPNAAEAASFSTTKLGYTVGGGIETGLAGRWTLKAEYLYVNFDTSSVGGFISPTLFGSNNNPFAHGLDLKANIVRAGLNYRF
jgi:outer membrane immunogenic protein